MPVDHLGFWTPPTTVHPSQLHAPLPPGVRVPAGYSVCGPIPPLKTPTVGELLDRYYGDKRNDPDWTDPNGPLSKQVEVYTKYPNNAAMPIGSSGLVGKWEFPNGLPAITVPMYGAEPPLDGMQVVVEFRRWDIVGPSAGISMGHIFDQKSDILKGANDFVLRGFWRRKLKLMIAWPGYMPILSTITVAADNGGPLTRFDLAQQITTVYGYFFKKVEVQRILPSEVGFYNIALHQGQNSKTDSLGIQLMQLHLVRFRNTISGYWVADVEIV